MKKIIKVTTTFLKILAIIFIIDVSVYKFDGKLVTVNYGHIDNFVFHTKLQTVGEVLDFFDIKLEDLDRINYSRSELTMDKMVIDIDVIRETEEVLYDTEEFTESSELSYSVPLFRTAIIVYGQNKITENTFKSVYKNGELISRTLINSVITQERIDQVVGIGRGNAIEFNGTLTGYSVQCPGCTGALYYASYQTGKRKWHTVDTQNIYFNYREDTIENYLCTTCYYIIAADKKIPGGSIVDLTLPNNSRIAEKTIRTIVLDVGSAIQGKTADLLFRTDNETFQEGRVYNVNFKIVRWGWN
jgi:3D (Asp-Asp-Asp) domain-containing protein